jgi:LmbE family N-acetylglucosaminyl deacetylase
VKALVLEPHDDDLIIGMGGTALKLMKKDWEFRTVQMTDGRHGSDEIEPEKLVEIRREEKEKEIDYLEIECEFLDHEDGALWDEMQKNRDEIVSNIREILSEFEPDIVFMPARNEGHPDHRATNLLASRALHSSEIEPLKASYIVWQMPFLEGENLANKVIRTEVEDVFEQKIEALRLHESQIEEGRYDEMVENFNSFLGLLYSSYDDKIGRSEVIGIQNPEKIEKLESLEFEDVSDMSHGRSTENIGVR